MMPGLSFYSGTGCNSAEHYEGIWQGYCSRESREDELHCQRHGLLQGRGEEED